MMKALLFSFVVSISNPAGPADVYIADSDLTLEDCADRIRDFRQINDSDYALTCERQNIKSDSSTEEPQADASGFISTGPGTFRTTWGTSGIAGLGEEPESKPHKRKSRKSRKAK